MWSISNFSSITIDLLRLFGLHFSPERFDGFGVLFTYDHPRRCLRAALVAKGADFAIGRFGPVLMLDASVMSAASLKCQRFFSRASERIRLSIVAEFVGVEIRTYSSLLQRCCRIAFGNRSDQIHSTLGRVFDVGVFDVSAIYHHLFRRFFRIGMDRIDAMDQFIVIRASLRRLDGYDVFMRGLGTNLNGCFITRAFGSLSLTRTAFSES